MFQAICKTTETISPHSLFFGEDRWFRVTAAICTMFGCMYAAFSISFILDFYHT